MCIRDRCQHCRRAFSPDRALSPEGWEERPPLVQDLEPRGSVAYRWRAAPLGDTRVSGELVVVTSTYGRDESGTPPMVLHACERTERDPEAVGWRPLGVYGPTSGSSARCLRGRGKGHHRDELQGLWTLRATTTGQDTGCVASHV